MSTDIKENLEQAWDQAKHEVGGSSSNVVSTSDSEQKVNNTGNNIFEVGIRMTLENVTEINTASQTFGARLKCKLTYPCTDEDIESYKQAKKNPKKKFLTEWEPESWSPLLVWPNALSPPDMTPKDDKDGFYEIMKDTDKATGKRLIAYDFAVSGTFMEHFELRSFPFDVQDLTIQLKLGKEPKHVPKNTIVLFAPDQTTSDFAKFNLENCVTTEWTVHEPMVEFGWSDKKESKSGKSKPLFIAKLKMARNYQFYLTRVCIYLAMLSFLALAAWSIEVESPGDRLGVDFTMLLSIIAYQLVVASLLPIVDFLTFIDKYMTFTIVFVGLVSLENALLGWIARQEADSEGEVSDGTIAIDNLCFYIISGIWLVGHIIFVIIGITTKNKELKKLQAGTNDLVQLNAGENDNEIKTFFFKNDEFSSENHKAIEQTQWVTMLGKMRG